MFQGFHCARRNDNGMVWPWAAQNFLDKSHFAQDAKRSSGDAQHFPTVLDNHKEKQNRFRKPLQWFHSYFFCCIESPGSRACLVALCRRMSDGQGAILSTITNKSIGLQQEFPLQHRSVGQCRQSGGSSQLRVRERSFRCQHQFSAEGHGSHTNRTTPFQTPQPPEPTEVHFVADGAQLKYRDKGKSSPFYKGPSEEQRLEKLIDHLVEKCTNLQSALHLMEEKVCFRNKRIACAK